MEALPASKIGPSHAALDRQQYSSDLPPVSMSHRDKQGLKGPLRKVANQKRLDPIHQSHSVQPQLAEGLDHKTTSNSVISPTNIARKEKNGNVRALQVD